MTIGSAAETKKEAVGNLDTVSDEFVRRLKVSGIVLFIGGMAISALFAFVSVTASFMAMASASGLFGGTIVAQITFSEVREVKQ